MSARPQPDASLVAGLVARGAVWRGLSGGGLPAQATGVAELDARLPGGGWPAGALSELLIAGHGIGELSLALPLLARLSQARQQVAFVAPPHPPYAPALAQAGLALDRVLVVEPASDDEALWSTEQLLRLAPFGAVLGWLPRLNEAAQRRLQLAAEAGGGIGLIYRPLRAATQASLSALRLALRPESSPAPGVEPCRLRAEILKARGGRPGARFTIPLPAPGSLAA